MKRQRKKFYTYFKKIKRNREQKKIINTILAIFP